ncbi:hypothetical protein KAI04_01930 [Candidatus Pacearchaeota archaeon]|nr:hypothetical protein [Candidatus Pacearchaeota archaeon]
MSKKIQKKVSRYFLKNTYRKEFRHELRLLIVITLGFTIGFTWRETIFDLSWALMQWMTHTQSSSALSILSSVFITLVCLGLIYLTSYFLKPKPGEQNNQY